ncbi:MAG: Mpo1-like protein [Phycisphaerae bacterium]
MKLLANWLQRHQHPASRLLHAVGIPLTLVAVVLATAHLVRWRWDLWWQPTALLAVGYLLQWIGHRIEASPMGELMLLQRLFGCGRGPRRNRQSPT